MAQACGAAGGGAAAHAGAAGGVPAAEVRGWVCAEVCRRASPSSQCPPCSWGQLVTLPSCPPAPSRPRRQQYEQLQADAQRAASQASRLAHENSQLKSRGGVPADADPALADPVAVQQVARQMEALLSEKSKLVAENDRLLRENTGLQVGVGG